MFDDKRYRVNHADGAPIVRTGFWEVVKTAWNTYPTAVIYDTQEGIYLDIHGEQTPAPAHTETFQ